MDRELEHRITRAWAKFGAFKGELCDKRYCLVHRLKLFNAVVTPTVLYGSECWTMTAARAQKLKVAQRKMLRKMLGTARKVQARGRPLAVDDGKEAQGDGAEDGSSEGETQSEGEAESTASGEESDDKEDKETWVEWMARTARVASHMMFKAKIPDWVQEQRRRKWRWAGHVVRRRDMRWSTRMVFWEPFRQGSRPVGRPATRWEDSVVKFAHSRGFNWHQTAEDRDKWKGLEDDFVRFEISVAKRQIGESHLSVGANRASTSHLGCRLARIRGTTGEAAEEWRG